MHPETARFVEQMGLLWAEEGFTRIAGRIYALALLSPKPLSLDEMSTTLQVSKPSISNDARMLHRIGLIERVGFPGDRKDYYQLTRDSIVRSIEARILRVEAFQKTMAGASTLPISDEDVLQRIDAHNLANRTVIEALQKIVTALKTSNPSPPPHRRSSRK